MRNTANKIKGIEAFGLPVVGSILAAMTIFVYQWMWFGSVFKVRWNVLIGLSEDQLVVPQSWWAVAFAFIIAQAFGVAHILRRAGWPSLRKCIVELSVFSALIATPLAAFPLLYHPDHSWERFAYEAGGFISAWIIGGLLIRLIKSPETSGSTVDTVAPRQGVQAISPGI